MLRNSKRLWIKAALDWMFAVVVCPSILHIEKAIRNTLPRYCIFVPVGSDLASSKKANKKEFLAYRFHIVHFLIHNIYKYIDLVTLQYQWQRVVANFSSFMSLPTICSENLIFVCHCKRYLSISSAHQRAHLQFLVVLSPLLFIFRCMLVTGHAIENDCKGWH